MPRYAVLASSRFKTEHPLCALTSNISGSVTVNWEPLALER